MAILASGNRWDVDRAFRLVRRARIDYGDCRGALRSKEYREPSQPINAKYVWRFGAVQTEFVIRVYDVDTIV